MRKAFRRRNFFIKKELQGKYIFAFFLFVVGGSIIFTLIFSILSANTLTITYNDYDLQIGQTPFILFREILRAHWIFIVTAGIGVVVVAIFITHRFAGPMFRFEKSVEEMLKGNFAFQIHLRKKDEGKELAEKMNQLIDMISLRENELRNLNNRISDCLAEARQSDDQTKEDTGTPDSVQEVRALNQKLRKILSQFKIKNDE